MSLERRPPEFLTVGQKVFTQAVVLGCFTFLAGFLWLRWSSARECAARCSPQLGVYARHRCYCDPLVREAP